MGAARVELSHEEDLERLEKEFSVVPKLPKNFIRIPVLPRKNIFSPDPISVMTVSPLPTTCQVGEV